MEGVDAAAVSIYFLLQGTVDVGRFVAAAAAAATALPEQSVPIRPRLVPNFSPKFYYAKRRFFVTSKCRHMHEVLNVDEIKN
jgi:hypothetical protein